MNKMWICLAMLYCSTWAVMAQEDDSMMRGAAGERVKAMKVAFITDRLNLTPQESQEFWPLYNQYEEEQRKIREKYKLSFNYANMTNAEAEKVLNNALELEQQMLNLKRDYMQRFRKALPVTKVAMLNQVERDFREELVKRLRAMQEQRQERLRRRN